MDKYVGESERKVRDLFERARKVSPSIIFFDEIDSISGNRTFVSGNEVGKKVLSTLLNEMDGMTAHSDKVMVVAATNRPDLVDDALLRPGRLDLMVYIPLPDRETRMEIFKKKNRQVVSYKHIFLFFLDCLRGGDNELLFYRILFSVDVSQCFDLSNEFSVLRTTDSVYVNFDNFFNVSD